MIGDRREGDREAEIVAVLAMAIGAGALLAIGALSFPALAIGAILGALAAVIVAWRLGAGEAFGEVLGFALLLAAVLVPLAFLLGALGPWADEPEQFRSIWSDQGRLSLFHLKPGPAALYREPMGWLPSALAAGALVFALGALALRLVVGLRSRGWR